MSLRDRMQSQGLPIVLLNGFPKDAEEYNELCRLVDAGKPVDTVRYIREHSGAKLHDCMKWLTGFNEIRDFNLKE